MGQNLSQKPLNYNISISYLIKLPNFHLIRTPTDLAKTILFNSRKNNMKKFLFVILGLIIISSGIVSVNATSINTSVTTVSIWDMIIFQGEGFHRLHNVEITIYHEDIVVSELLSQTTDKGVLFLPLIINDFTPGKYDVLATDNINTATTSFEI